MGAAGLFGSGSATPDPPVLSAVLLLLTSALGRLTHLNKGPQRVAMLFLGLWVPLLAGTDKLVQVS